MKVYLQMMLVWFVAIQSVVAEEAPKSVHKLIKKWGDVWNREDADAMKLVYHKDAMFVLALQNMPEQVSRRFVARAKFYGKVDAIKVVGYYPKANRCLALADFGKLKGHPIVFELKPHGKIFRIVNETFGIDPTEKRDDAKADAYAKQWSAALNAGHWKAIRETLHSKSDMLMQLKMSKGGEAKAAKELTEFMGQLGKVKGHVIKGYRKNTSEYVIEFDYEKKGKVVATVILKKDFDDKIRCSRMDIDDGARALKDMDSWQPK